MRLRGQFIIIIFIIEEDRPSKITERLVEINRKPESFPGSRTGKMSFVMSNHALREHVALRNSIIWGIIGTKTAENRFFRINHKNLK